MNTKKVTCPHCHARFMWLHVCYKYPNPKYRQIGMGIPRAYVETYMRKRKSKSTEKSR